MFENILVNIHNLSDILLQVFFACCLILRVPLVEVLFYLLVHSSVQKFRHNFVNRLRWNIGQRPYCPDRFDGFPSGQGMTTGSFLYTLYYNTEMTNQKKVFLTVLTLGFLGIRWFSGRHTLLQLAGGLLVGFLQRLFCKFVCTTFERLNFIKLK